MNSRKSLLQIDAGRRTVVVKSAYYAAQNVTVVLTRCDAPCQTFDKRVAAVDFL